MPDFKFGVPGPPGSPWSFPGGFAPSPPLGEGPDTPPAALTEAERLVRVPGAVNDPFVRFTEIVSQVWNSLVRRRQLVKVAIGEYEIVATVEGDGITGDFE